jgi:hypothetical protein
MDASEAERINRPSDHESAIAWLDLRFLSSDKGQSVGVTASQRFLQLSNRRKQLNARRAPLAREVLSDENSPRTLCALKNQQSLHEDVLTTSRSSPLWHRKSEASLPRQGHPLGRPCRARLQAWSTVWTSSPQLKTCGAGICTRKGMVAVSSAAKFFVRTYHSPMRTRATASRSWPKSRSM